MPILFWIIFIVVVLVQMYRLRGEFAERLPDYVLIGMLGAAVFGSPLR